MTRSYNINKSTGNEVNMPEHHNHLDHQHDYHHKPEPHQNPEHNYYPEHQHKPEYHIDSNGNALAVPAVGIRTSTPEIHIEPIDEEDESPDAVENFQAPEIKVSSFDDDKAKDRIPTPDANLDSDSEYEIHPGVTKPSEYTKSDSLDRIDHKPLPQKEELPKVDTRCGCGHCHPSFIQTCCNNPKAFLLWLSLFAFVQGKYSRTDIQF